MKFLKVVWWMGVILVYSRLMWEIPLPDDARTVFAVLLLFATLILVLIDAGIALLIMEFGKYSNEMFLCHYIDKVPEVLYYMGKISIVEKEGKYAVRRGLICHQYFSGNDWFIQPCWESLYYAKLRYNIAIQKLEKEKKPKKPRIRILSEQDIILAEAMERPEYKRALKELGVE